MNYRALKNHWIKLESKAETEIDAGQGTILVPPPNSKVFLHWLNEKGKLVSTYTMTYPTQVQNKVKLINAQSTPISIQAIEI